MVITLSKGWRDGNKRLAIRNNQHTPNIYSKLSLIEGNKYKLSGCESPFEKGYLLFFLATTANSRPEEAIKKIPLQNKPIQTYPLPPQI